MQNIARDVRHHCRGRGWQPMAEVSVDDKLTAGRGAQAQCTVKGMRRSGRCRRQKGQKGLARQDGGWTSHLAGGGGISGGGISGSSGGGISS